VLLALALAGGARAAEPVAPAVGSAPPAAGGALLLRGAERAARVVVGVVEVDPARIDQHGFAATLRVERELRPPPEPGPATLRIAWEELAPARRPRFEAGGRVVVALEPLPSGSLWRQRFPKRDALAVAENGSAFLRDPDAATIDGLARFCALAPDERDAAPGVAALAALAAGGAPPLAEAAVARLAEIPGLGNRLDAEATAALANAIDAATRPEAVRVGLLSLAGERRLAALRPAAERASRSAPPLAAAGWQAVAAIDGGLDAERLRALLAGRDAGVRAVAVAWAVGTPEEPTARRLARSDPVAEVRAAAVRALLDDRSPDALEIGLEALFDSDPAVRAQAAQSVARYGPEVVPRLRELALSRSGAATAGPMAALALAGPAGLDVLRELSHEHPDEDAQAMARLMLGRDPRHEH
jgi:hypothetical protein